MTVGLTVAVGLAGGGVGTIDLPAPLIDTAVEPPAALWVKVSKADLDPVEVGENVTVTFCDDPGTITTLDGATENCKASAPPTAMPVTDKLAPPVLEIVKIFWDDEPTRVLSIAKGDGATPITGGAMGELTTALTCAEGGLEALKLSTADTR